VPLFFTAVILLLLLLDIGKTNKDYTLIDKAQKKKYIEEILINKKFPYEKEAIPTASKVIGAVFVA